GAAADVHIAVGVGEVDQEEAALRAALEVLGLQPRRVERGLQLALVVEEPHFGELRDAVAADGGQRGELGVEQVAVGLREVGHARDSAHFAPAALVRARIGRSTASATTIPATARPAASTNARW